ncbi:TPA: hypothetical protein ACPHTW_004604, partial [Vibrio antiquarius]
KSKIHQKRKKIISESDVIDYSVEVLKYFSLKRFKFVDDGDKLRAKSNRIISFISRRFIINSRGVRLSKFHSSPVQRVFISEKASSLYRSLSVLIGEYGLWDENISRLKPSIPSSDLFTFFVSPEFVYELHVYDQLIRNFSRYNVLFQPDKKFSILNPDGSVVDKKSVPDFVVYSDRYVRVIDAKWKVIKNRSDIHYNDIIKLKRDYDIFCADFAILVYPEVPEYMVGMHKMELGDGSYFCFWIYQFNNIK